MRSRSGSDAAPTSSATACTRSASASSRDGARPPLAPRRIALLGVPARDVRHVARRRLAPAHRRVVAGVGEVAVQRPHAAHEAPRVRGHRLGHVAAGRRHRAEDRDRADAARQRLHAAGALVERGERGREAGRIALLGRQLAGARGDLAQRLGPARGRVRDDERVVAHVAVELGDRDAGVDADLARHQRHVRGVGDQHGAVQQRAAGARILERRISCSTSASSLPRSPQLT